MVQLGLWYPEAGHLWGLVPLSLFGSVAHSISGSLCVGSTKPGLHEDPRDCPGVCVQSPVGFTACYYLLHFLVFPWISGKWNLTQVTFLSKATSWIACQNIIFSVRFLVFRISVKPWLVQAVVCSECWSVVCHGCPLRRTVGGAILLSKVCEYGRQYTWH